MADIARRFLLVAASSLIVTSSALALPSTFDVPGQQPLIEAKHIGKDSPGGRHYREGPQQSRAHGAGTLGRPPAASSTRAPATTAPAPVAQPPAAASSSTADPAGGPAEVTPEVPAPVPAQSASTVPSGSWLSGASGTGVASGAFGAWRGSDLEIASTWADNNRAMVECWQLGGSGEFANWNKPLDVAIGAIGQGESWQQAAQGAYDARWRQSLTKMRDLWGGRSATLYIRFAHEMNGNWYDWSVNAGNASSFVQSWKRFRAVQQEVFPQSKLVFNVNRESVSNGIDWRKTFPGAAYVDVMGVDYYNQWPYVADDADWRDSLDDVDGYGAPEGLQKHLDFARSVGLPLSVSEWSGNADNGDSVAFIRGMHQFFSDNAGGGAGQLLYEVQFNVDRDGRRWMLHGPTRMPASAEAYRDLW